jgi:hypothetical protein
MKTKLQSVISGFLGVICTLPISLSYNQAVQAQYNPNDDRGYGTRIRLYNQSRRSSVIGLYVWNRDRQEWSRNRLDSPLEPGSDERVMLSRQDDRCNYRIKVVYADNRESTTRLNACEYRHVVVRQGELFIYRRNPDRD